MDQPETGAAFFLRAEAVRLILQGIYDNDERAFALRFVADAEKLAGSQTHKGPLPLQS